MGLGQERVKLIHTVQVEDIGPKISVKNVPACQTLMRLCLLHKHEIRTESKVSSIYNELAYCSPIVVILIIVCFDGCLLCSC